MFRESEKKKLELIFFLLILVNFMIIFELFVPRNSSPPKLKSTNNIDNLDIAVKLEWNKTIIWAENSEGRDLIIDINDNIYIVGNIFNSAKGVNDIIIIKYNNLGDKVWNKTWGGYSDDYGFAIDIDSSNNIYIVGQTRSYGNNSYNICLIKYDCLGNHLWNTTWGKDGNDAAYSITVSNDNYIYVTGYTESDGEYANLILLKYNVLGNLVWKQLWGGIDTDIANDVVVDLLGNIYITGYTSSFGIETSDLFLIKFNSSGNIQWNYTWGGLLPDSGNSVKIDSLNNIILAGNTQNLGKGSNDIILLKLNSNGELIWNYTWGGIGYEYGYSVVLDSKENIFISGFLDSREGNDRDVCLLKFDMMGNLIWNQFWGKEFDAISYDVEIDSYDNIFMTGKLGTSENYNKLFLINYSSQPSDFYLSSLENLPDIDGNITLVWTTSLDADNYSMFQSNNYIDDVNENVTRLIEGYDNNTYKIENLGESIHYFRIIAYNEYGFTSSNCLKIKVQFPPSSFILFNYTQKYCSDGSINLTWANSIGADNYSVFMSNDFINDVQNEGTLISNQIICNNYQLDNLTNGDYFFVIAAKNEVGQAESNCIKVKVRRAPVSFQLASNANQPDLDGNFELVWNNSEFAQNYSIYYSNYSISKINNRVITLYDGFTPPFLWPNYRYQISNWQNGTYYFMVVAYNMYGNYSTNCLEIKIDIPRDPNENPVDNNNNFEFKPEFLLPFTLIGLLVTLIIIRYKFKKESHQ
ncbi:MAG: SBBP repeat-containing protein [Candidatus Hermodarchaeota archaeon]